MSGRYLLDTNIIIALFADEAGVKIRYLKTIFGLQQLLCNIR